MTFNMDQRVRTTVNVESMWPNGQDVPAGSLGTVVALPVGLESTTYGILIDTDRDQMPMTYDANEITPA